MYKIGALTSKVSAFKARPWELTYIPSVDVEDSLGSNLLLNLKGRKILSVIPSYNTSLQIEWISDKSRYVHETNTFHRLYYPAIGTEGIFKKILYKNRLKMLIQGWMASLSNFDIVLGSNLDLIANINLKAYSRNYGVDLKSESLDFLLRTFNINYISNKSLNNLDQMEFTSFLGVNTRTEAPIGNLLFRLRYLKGDFKASSIGSAVDLNFNLKNYGSKSLSFSYKIYGINVESTYVFSPKSKLTVYSDTCSQRFDSTSWLKLNSRFNYLSSFYIRFSTQADNVSQAYLNYSKWLEKNNTCFLRPLYIKSIKLVARMKFIIYTSHLNPTISRADILCPSASLLEKNLSFLSYDGKLKQGTKALSPYLKSLESMKNISQILKLKNHKESFRNLIKTSLQKHLTLLCYTFDLESCYLFKNASKLINSPLKTCVSNMYISFPYTKTSNTLNELAKINYENYISFLVF